MQKYNNYLNLPNNTIKNDPNYLGHTYYVFKKKKKILSTLPFGV